VFFGQKKGGEGGDAAGSNPNRPEGFSEVEKSATGRLTFSDQSGFIFV
jgi:hypothetical protein